MSIGGQQELLLPGWDWEERSSLVLQASSSLLDFVWIRHGSAGGKGVPVVYGGGSEHAAPKVLRPAVLAVGAGGH